ncbi:MAG: HAD family hydrolase [Coriobacteriales bacterium]|nr:HAD family hydrolase [Coriobacteriales bacterium]
MIKLVLTDLDDTLIPFEDKGIAAPQTLAAIKTLLEAGVHFGPVTGRTPNGTGEAFANDAHMYATGAFANGQLICLDGEVVHREWTPAEPLQRAADILDEIELGVLIDYDMEGDRGARYISKKPERLGVIEDFGFTITNAQPAIDGDTLKANIRVGSPSREVVTEVRDILRREVPELDFVFPSNLVPIIDILPAGFGKGSAVRILAKTMGIRLDEVATFGDSENDLQMLEAVPNSVAMANANDEVKRAARWHIGTSASYAAADALLDIAAATMSGRMPSFMQEGR